MGVKGCLPGCIAKHDQSEIDTTAGFCFTAEPALDGSECPACGAGPDEGCESTCSRLQEYERTRCIQSVCPGSVGGDHDGNCAFYSEEV